MSYAKAMKHACNPRKGKAQYMGFDSLGQNERRKEPRHSIHYYENTTVEQRIKDLRKWQEETERLLKINPNLKIVN